MNDGNDAGSGEALFKNGNCDKPVLQIITCGKSENQIDNPFAEFCRRSGK